jgi:glycosyltransferase involved in cell wall biosynthesis
LKRILFITTRLINPVNSGTKVVLYNYCKGLKDKFDCEIYQYSFYDDENDIKTKQPEFIKEVLIAEQPNLIEKIYNVLKYSIMLKKWPFQVALYYKRSNIRELNMYIDKIEPDIIICDMIRTAEYGKSINFSDTIKVLEMQDLLSKRYDRQIDVLKEDEGVFGAYAKNIPKIARKFILNKRILTKIFKLESDLLKRYEVEVSNNYDHLIFVSKIEAEEINKRGKFNKAFDISMGVDYEYFSEKISVERNKNTICFIGNMNVAHNKDAVSNIINNILPDLIKENNKIKLRVVGKCAEEYKKQYENNRNIEITGQVDDIRKYVKECACVVVPLSYGSGIKTKVLEAMAMGVPVITNSVGAEGISKCEQKELIICDSYSEFVKNILIVLEDDELACKLSENGKDYVKTNFSWNKNLENFSRIFSK